MRPLRLDRLRELMKEELSAIIQQEMKDPRVGFVSITDVELSSDLRHAKVFVSVFGDEQAKAQTMEALEGALGFIRTELGRRIKVHHIPEIAFRLDDSIERGTRVIQLLRQVTHGTGSVQGEGSGEHEQRDERAGEDRKRTH